jgi:hypothetical protein
MTVTTKLVKKSLNNPDETRPFGQSKMELVNINDVTIGRITLMPGWSWEKDVKPLVNTQSCQVAHTQYCLQGRLKVIMDDGAEFEIGPGDAVAIPPGHKACVLGNEPFRAIEFTGAKEYAQNPLDAESDWDEIMDIE